MLFGVGMLEQAIVPSQAGRFGWKARYPNLEAVIAGALAGEMGLTSERFPDVHGGEAEVSRSEVKALVAFVRDLPPPVLEAIVGSRREGEGLFVDIGCAACHLPALQIVASSGSRQLAPAYTDLRLHDLGPALADGLSEGHASGSQFRTPPLWGMRYSTSGFLHDGRAATIPDAIIAHAGEASAAVARFRALDDARAAALIAFVSGL